MAAAMRPTAKKYLAIFDLDNTLLRGDSDYLWGTFLIDKELVDPEFHRSENDRFYREYEAGQMDIMAFLEFQLQPLARISMDTLLALRGEYLRTCIEPIITDQARRLVEHHRSQHAELLIVTATNSFITRPIAEAFGVRHLIATEPELRDGKYTGGVNGTPSYQHGKVARLNEWLAGHDMTLEDSWFYSDSANDLPLLELVDHPVAVNPDKRLYQHARTQGWPILHMDPPD